MSFPNYSLKNHQIYSLAYTSNESINSYQLLFIITSIVLESALRHELLHSLCQMKSVLLKRHCSFLFYGCFSLQEKSMSHTTVAGSRKNDILLFNTPTLGAEGSVDRGKQAYISLVCLSQHGYQAKDNQDTNILSGLLHYGEFLLYKQGLVRIRESLTLNFIPQNPVSPVGSRRQNGK